MDVLPSIGQYDPDVDSAYSCASCHANLQVVEKVTNSRGRVRSILTTPKQCHKCGAPTTNSQILAEKDLHESVVDTLHRGDSRFIVDHRRFKKSSVVHPSSGNNPADLHSNSPMDWRDDLESFRLHMSRQSQTEDELDTIVYGYKRNRSESGSSSVFMTEPGANIDETNHRMYAARGMTGSHVQKFSGIMRTMLKNGKKEMRTEKKMEKKTGAQLLITI